MSFTRVNYKISAILFSALIIASAVLPAFAAPRDEAEKGEYWQEPNIVYYEDFNYENTTGNAEVEKLLGWKILSYSDQTAPSGNTAQYSIKQGRLFVNNIRGSDSYIRILDDAVMRAATEEKDYVLQFDVTLTNAGNTARYLAIVTDYTESREGNYNSFHLRINGSANNQTRAIGAWYTYDAAGEYYAGDQKDGDGTSTIAYKVLGKNFDGTMLLRNVSLTIRLVCPAVGCGPEVYIRNNSAKGDFVLVSKPYVLSGGASFWRGAELPGRAVVLKAGGTIDGYIDNVLIYTGKGEPIFECEAPPETEPPETTAVPETVAAPETTLPELTDELPSGGCSSIAALPALAYLPAYALLAKRKRRD